MMHSTNYAPDGSLLTGEDHELAILAVSAALEAGTVLLNSFSEPPRNVGTKEGPVDLVSDADRESEAVILDRLKRERPGDTITSEESGRIEGASGLHWLVDPLDGTHNFLRGMPLWCVSIAVTDDHGPRVGVVHDPLHDECFLGIRGRGSSLNRRQMPAYARSRDVDSFILGGSCRRAAPAGSPRAIRLSRFVDTFANTRELVAGALELAWTAAGRFDTLYHESKMKPVDASAGMLLCSEADLAVHSLLPAADGERNRLLVCPPGLSEQLLSAVS